LRASLDSQEELTEALGVQVRKAVELLVAAFGRIDVRDRERGGPGLRDVDAHDVYRGAVTVMMRIVFLLFAEERKLLPSDNDLYATAYSVGRLCDELEQRVIEGSEEHLEHTTAAWCRLLALFNAVYQGVDHPRLTMHGHDGSLFDPAGYPWLPLSIDDRTVLHMLRAVQYVQVGTGRNRERRRLSFRALYVEQIGFVYEGLLSFEGFRAGDVVVGLIGKEGQEDEVPLADLEAHAAAAPGVDALAAKLAEAYKDSKIGSAKALAKRLAPLEGVAREETLKKLLAVTGGDYPLAQRLLPFVGVIREDLRGLPTVILPGALFVTESALRRNTGTHYTPRFLAEEVVEGALEPLVYSPGPLQTANKAEWTLRSSAEILALKVADIAMGSAAFLVAAARYLADHLIEAWSREGDERARAYVETATDRQAGLDEDPLVIEARRQIIEHCLYGVDINPMAVEMAKLSLWLVSMDPDRPFTFLDDRLAAGDSLLGITSLEQLEYLHLDPVRGRKLHEDLLGWAAGVAPLVREVADLRRQIAGIQSGADPLGALAHKRELLAEAEAKTKQLRLFADLVVGAALVSSRKGPGSKDPNAREDIEEQRAAGREGRFVEAARLADAAHAGRDAEALTRRAEWLATDHVPGSFPREPLHWPLVFPEVFEHGGFDAVIGNPPFLGGQKLTGTMGVAYREHLVESIGRGERGSADLVAYFALRAHDLLNPTGQSGLIATNTLAQGDTRQVGLDRMADEGVTIRKAIKSKPWPSRSAVLEFCAVWASRAPLGERAVRIADGAVVSGITPALDPASRVRGNPHRLKANGSMSFQGSIVLGLGFTMSPDEAAAFLEKDARNRDVLFPYLNGQDLNSRPDASGSRWVINFHDWPEDRARTYPDCYGRVLRLVKPERDGNNRKVRRERWWQYAERSSGLYEAIQGLDRVIAIARVSKTVLPLMVPTGQVASEMVVVFATDDTAMLALLSSGPHYWWTVSRASTMKADIRYTPSDVFETLPLPELTQRMRELGHRLDTRRREIMLAREAGLTATYGLVNDESCRDEDIVELRRIHEEIDVAVCGAYGWDDLVKQRLDHGCHKSGPYLRYTVGPAAQREIVDRLLELNHERYAEEEARGLHAKKKPAKARKAKAKAQPEGQEAMF
ncbi:MAG: SAM-dependent DNA methyltransferase, partial [Micromonosporaceae bacterium]|nr:SAM-dependent DNA methyltransferase [Micromonosporaceae bacterium]